MKKTIALVFIVLVFASLTGNSFAVVNSNERGLVAVINLYSTAPTKLKRYIYKRESDRAASFIKKKASKAYGHVVVLEHDEATLANFLNEVEKMALREEIKVIDVIFDLHGFSGRESKETAIRFVNINQETTPTALVSEKLRLVANSKIRMLYSDACYGVEHNQDWLDAGFKVVSGSKDVDGNQSIDIKRFFKKWIKGRSFYQALQTANSSLLSPLLDEIIGGDSTKIIGGDDSISISSD